MHNAKQRIEEVVAHCHYPFLRFEVDTEDWWLRVVSDKAIDNFTEEERACNGRKWRISSHMLDGEIVQTALLAVKSYMEHEIREQFTFYESRLFSPHFDIYALAKFALNPLNTVERDPYDN